MLTALAQGTTDPEVLAELARGRLRGKLPALRIALAGRFRTHHAFLVGQLLSHLDYLEEAIGTLSTEIERHLVPFSEQLSRLDSIPGINRRTAEVIIAEIGVDMSAFPTAAHLASWAALCPGNNESAGKHKSGKTQRQPLVTHRADRSCGRGESREAQRAAGAVSADSPPSGSEEGGRRLGPRAVTDRLSRLGARDDVSGARRRLL